MPNIATGFNVGAPVPVDNRMTRKTISERDSIPEGVRFEGLEVFVEETKIKYRLEDGVTNDCWVDKENETVKPERTSFFKKVSHDDYKVVELPVANGVSGEQADVTSEAWVAFIREQTATYLLKGVYDTNQVATPKVPESCTIFDESDTTLWESVSPNSYLAKVDVSGLVGKMAKIKGISQADNCILALFIDANGNVLGRYGTEGNVLYGYTFAEGYENTNYTIAEILEVVVPEGAKYLYVRGRRITSGGETVVDGVPYIKVAASVYKIGAEYLPEDLVKAVQENREFINELPTDFELQKNKGVANGYPPLDIYGKIGADFLPVDLVKRSESYFGASGNIPVVSGASSVRDSEVNIEDLEKKENKNQPNGYAGLDENGKMFEEQTPDGIKNALGYTKTMSKNLLNVEDGEYAHSSGRIVVTAENNQFSIGGTFREDLPYTTVVDFPVFTVEEDGSYTLSVYADDDYLATDGTFGFTVSLRKASDKSQLFVFAISQSMVTSKNYPLTAGEDYFVRIATNSTYAQPVGAIFEEITFKLQLEKGTTSTEWEDPTSIYEQYTLPKDVTELKSDMDEVKLNLDGKVVMCLGDSIMYGAGDSGSGIGDIIVAGYDATLYDYSQGGATIGYRASSADGSVDYTGGSKQNITYQAELAVAQAVTPDYILINGGTNDIGTLNIPTGEMSSGYDVASIDKSTFTGGLEYIFGILKAAYPSARIIYIRSHNMVSRDYNRQIVNGNRAFEVCEKWSIAAVNIFRDSGLNTNLAEMHCFTASTETYPNGDRTHPTREGYERFYIPQIVSVMKTGMGSGVNSKITMDMLPEELLKTIGEFTGELSTANAELEQVLYGATTVSETEVDT